MPLVWGGRTPIYAAMRPDSEIEFGGHPEMALLARSWTANNEDRNALDTPRFVSLILNIKQVLRDGIAGDFAELGVYKGNSAAILRHFAEVGGRTVFLFDTFEGFDRADLAGRDSEKPVEFGDTSLDAVRQVAGTACAQFIKGRFPGSIPSEVYERRFAIVHLDCDLYEPTRAALDFFYPRLSSGGMLILHDYGGVYWDGIQRAVDDFLRLTGERLVLLPDKSGTAIVRKSARMSL